MFQHNAYNAFGKSSVTFVPEQKEIEIEEVMDYSAPVPKKIVKPRYLPGERLLKTLNSNAAKQKQTMTRQREAGRVGSTMWNIRQSRIHQSKQKQKNSHVKSSIEDILADLNL